MLLDSTIPESSGMPGISLELAKVSCVLFFFFSLLFGAENPDVVTLLARARWFITRTREVKPRAMMYSTGWGSLAA